jgi:hypothetical protein
LPRQAYEPCYVNAVILNQKSIKPFAMKKTVLFLSLLMPFIWLNSQTTEAEKQLKAQAADSLNGWKKGGMINLNLAQTSLTNWAAGGQSSIAVNGLINLYARYKKDNGLWENFLDLGYGSLKQGKKNWWKTDDRIDFTSKYGYKTSRNFYLAALVNFRSQFANGYNYPNDSVKISGFMSPGYFLGAVGIEYRPGGNFDLFFAPLTGKLTLVTDQALADAGAFGVTPGDNLYSEFGGYMRLFLKKDLMENISIQTKLDLFTNYLHNPQNVDVNWECLIALKVNKFISATISTDMIYDDDIKIAVDKNDDGIVEKTKPMLQFKEVLAVGFAYKF